MTLSISLSFRAAGPPQIISLDAAGHEPEARRLLDSALVRRVLACMIIVIMIAISIWILTYVLFL